MSRICGFRTLCALSLGLVGCCTVEARAAFEKVDDFQTSLGTDTWAGSVIADPTSSDNHVASGVDFGSTSLPASIAQGDTGTLFFRMYLEPLSAGYSYFKGIRVGVSDETPAQIGTSSFSLFANANEYFGSNSSFDPITSPTIRQWYNVWAVINNDADTVRYYLTQNNDLPTADSALIVNGTSDVPFFRTTDLPIISLAVAGSAYLDDIYLDPSNANLTSPVPEPAALSSAAMALLLARRRRTARA